MFFQKRKKIITHNGSFHADDIFACASILLLLDKKGERAKIIRTRDEEMIKRGHYVFDVGGVYDPRNNLFDHHQSGGAGERENGIPYSSFGLIWEKFGEDVCGSKEVAEIIDRKLVQPIDAYDNGIDLIESKNKISPYLIQDAFVAMMPALSENKKNSDAMFLESVNIAKEILRREMIHIKDAIVSEQKIKSLYDKTEDKRFLVLDEPFHDEYVLAKFENLLFVIYPRKNDDTWGIRAVREDPKTFKNRKNFPANWAGLRNEDLQKITGIKDAIFCHKGLFLAVAKSKEGAIKLVELALT